MSLLLSTSTFRGEMTMTVTVTQTSVMTMTIMTKITTTAIQND